MVRWTTLFWIDALRKKFKTSKAMQEIFLIFLNLIKFTNGKLFLYRSQKKADRQRLREFAD